MGKFNKCCCCGVGAQIVRWQNVTKVRPTGDSLPATYDAYDGTTYPYPRFDTDIYNADNPTANCTTLSPGACGGWLVGGDLHGLSEQVINAGTDDIQAPVTPDSTHVVFDHNSYLQTSDTVDMREPKLKGGQWIFSKHYFNGTLGWTSPDACITDPPTLAAYPADTTKYLTLGVNADLVCFGYSGGTMEVDKFYGISHAGGSITVNARSGITNSTLLTTEKIYTGATDTSGTLIENISGGAGLFTDGKTYGSGLSTRLDTAIATDVHCAGIALPTFYALLPLSGLSYFNIQDFVSAWNSAHGSDDFGTIPAVTDVNNYDSGAHHAAWANNPGTDYQTDSVFDLHVAWSRTATVYTWSFTLVYSVAQHSTGTVNLLSNISWSGSLTLSNPYELAQYTNDLNALSAAWDMSDLSLAKFRNDETLPLAPVCAFDCVESVKSPLQGFIPATMDDYYAGLTTDINGVSPGGAGYITTWTQRAWLDPNSYVWQYPCPTGGWQFTMPSGFTSGANLVTPMRTGEIVAHSNAGCDRSFWFGFNEFRRRPCTSDEDGYSSGYLWELYRHGGLSDALIAAVALRWQNKLEAQYEPAPCNPNAISEGNYPQAFFRYGAGTGPGLGIAGKFVMASIKYDSVCYARPCGEDRFAVEQSSVCYVADSSGFNATTGGTLTVAATAGATAPSSGYALVEGNGIYPITGLSGATLTVGARIDTLPSGVNCFPPELWGTDTYHGAGGFYVGKLRWTGYTNYGVSWTSAPGLCGRVAVTAVYSGGTLTVTTSSAQPYFRKGSDSAQRPVNLYDASWTKLNGSPLTMTRTDDSHFTVAGANYPTAVWMIDAQFDSAIGWEKYTVASQKNFVLAKWNFSRRAMSLASPPFWFNGIAGVLNGTLTQYSYTSGACPAAIGIVPFYDAPMLGDSPLPGGSPLPAAEPAENFANQELFPSPDLATDEFFGAHAQAAVLLSMVDPFWETPFRPDRGGTDSFTWRMDDGSGLTDSPGGTPPIYYYPLAPMVEAATTVASGNSLPAGLYLPLDPAQNAVAPPYWSNGIPNADNTWATVTTEWGTAGRICANILAAGRFSALYASYGLQC